MCVRISCKSAVFRILPSTHRPPPSYAEAVEKAVAAVARDLADLAHVCDVESMCLPLLQMVACKSDSAGTTGPLTPTTHPRPSTQNSNLHEH